jgi:hypothetical protein
MAASYSRQTTYETNLPLQIALIAPPTDDGGLHIGQRTEYYGTNVFVLNARQRDEKYQYSHQHQLVASDAIK